MMNTSELKEIFFDRADVKEAEEIACDKCFEPVVFALEDSKQRRFSVGLSTILECVAFAIENGDLPKLPNSWLNEIDSCYHTDFSYNKNISYFDYNDLKGARQ